MKVTYIGHSGFLLETDGVYFLFDYYKGEIPKLNAKKPIVVLVSHKHGDHYNPMIFELIKQYPLIYYVLSKDVPVKWKLEEFKNEGISLEEHVTVMRKNEETELKLPGEKSVHIKTLKSTDIGVAFLLEYEGKRYYHAGDLNLWLWEGESKQYNDNMRMKYFRELEKLKGMEMEAAFVPLDPRQEKDAFAGMESFLEYTKAKNVFPMHFWENYGIIEDFLNEHPKYEKQLIRITEAGQTFEGL